MAYQLFEAQTAQRHYVKRLADGAMIPVGVGGRDYREYLDWVAAGNTPLPAVQPPDYVAFWDALAASAAYGAIRTQAMASLAMNTLATEFIALIGDAKAGRPNQGAIQASIEAILSAGSFSAGQKAEFAAALEAGHLGDLYTLP
jgi:hypothetical protein